MDLFCNCYYLYVKYSVCSVSVKPGFPRFCQPVSSKTQSVLPWLCHLPSPECKYLWQQTMTIPVPDWQHSPGCPIPPPGLFKNRCIRLILLCSSRYFSLRPTLPGKPGKVFLNASLIDLTGQQLSNNNPQVTNAFISPGYIKIADHVKLVWPASTKSSGLQTLLMSSSYH